MDDRECLEVLICPSCGGVDVDQVLLEYRCFRCGLCGATVRITDYKVFLDRPSEGADVVEMHGVPA